MNAPKISVVMPVFNSRKYIDKAIISILNQDFTDFEFLIFDDGSSDGSLKRLDHFAARDSRIKIFRRTHGGYSRLLNEGIELAKGEFIARMDSDDIAASSRFSVQLAFLEANPDYIAVGSQVTIVDPDGFPIGFTESPVTHEDIEHTHLQVDKNTVICHPSLLARKSALSAIDGYRESLETAEDRDLYLRLALIGKLGNINQPLLKYRRHFKTVSHSQRKRQLEFITLCVNEARKQRGLEPQKNKQINQSIQVNKVSFYSGWANRAHNSGFRITALKLCIQLIILEPTKPVFWKLLTKILLGNRTFRWVKYLANNFSHA